MAKDIIYEITNENLNTGLKKIPMGHCFTSYAHPSRGMFYVGRPLAELYDWKIENVIYLLYKGREGSDLQIDVFFQDLKKRAYVDPDIINRIFSLPKMSVMDVFSFAIKLLKEKDKNEEEEVLDVIAKLPIITAACINFHAGVGGSKIVNDGSYLMNFKKMLKIPIEHEMFFKTLQLIGILNLDLGGGSLPSFVAKKLFSSGVDIYSCLFSSILALSGNKVNAYEESSCIIEDMKNVSDKDFEDELKSYLEKKGKLPSFGHPFYEIEDPIATVLYNYAQKYFSESKLVASSLLYRKIGQKTLSGKRKFVYPNSLAITSCLFKELGFLNSHYYPVITAMFSIIGVAIQLLTDKDVKTPVFHSYYFYKARS